MHASYDTRICHLFPLIAPSPLLSPTDRGIGYGPGPDISGSTAAQLPASKVDDTFHPPAPPITAHGERMEAGNDVLKFDSNFLMARPGEANEVRHVSASYGQS